ncbi:MAG TPA: CHASE3 domain-containing protein [Bryobacteraceae bacterium]
MALRQQGRIDRLWRYLAIAIVLGIGFLFYHEWREFQAADHQVDETRQLEKQTDDLISSITDAETGQRGYLLTGDPQYLEPYRKAVKLIPGELSDLAATAAVMHRHEKDVATLKSLIHDKMADLQRTIDLRDQAGADAALALMRTDEGRLAMEEVRNVGKLLLSTEYMKLHEHEYASESNANNFLIIVLVGCVGLVFLLVRMGWAVDSVVKEREEFAERIEDARRMLERWKQTFSGAGFGMFVADSRTGLIVDMNPTFAAMHGYSVTELLGSKLSDLVPPRGHEEFSSALHLVGEKGRHMFEQQHLRRDGTGFPSLVDVTRLVDGRSEFLVGYCSDNTERKRVEDALKESEERFRTLASALPELIWSTDAEGNIEYVNQVWTSYAGWESGDEARQYIPLRPWKDLLHPEDRDEYFSRWKESLGSGAKFEVQARLRRSSDGNWRWFLCRAVAVRDRANQIVRWLGGCTDIQQQMEGATQLKLANLALQQSNADLEQFAYAASHDLQEPLRMVSIYSQLLKEEYGNALDRHALSYIDFAVNGARRMSHLLTGLLSYSRVANALPEISPKADSRAAVKSALLNLASVIDDAGASVELADNLPLVQLPEIHLVQLFQNLVGNALKYRRETYPEGERPTVRIDVKQNAGGAWLFSISDNGIGIEPEYRTQIFGIFKRLHGPAFEGTGIGLALCQKIVERAGGHIWVESEPGKGSTFFFTLQGVETGEYELASYSSAGRG